MVFGSCLLKINSLVCGKACNCTTKTVLLNAEMKPNPFHRVYLGRFVRLNQDDYLSVCITDSLYIVIIQSACTYLILDLLNLKDVYLHNLKYS